MADLNTILSHAPSIVTRKTGNEYVLVPVTNNIADMDSVYTLNETGAFIWEHIDGKRSLSEITDLLVQEYEIEYEIAKDDIISFVENMKAFLIVSEM